MNKPKGFKSFLNEMTHSNSESLNHRKDYLESTLIFSVLFFTLYYACLIIPFYGINSVRFQVDFLAGSIIPVGLIIAIFMSKKNYSQKGLGIPSFATGIAALVLLYNADFYSVNNHLWAYAQTIGVIFASYLTNVRSNIFIYVFNIIAPQVLCFFCPHLVSHEIFEDQALVHFASLIGIYFSYQSTINYREMLARYKNADLIRYASGLGTWQWDLTTNQVEFDNRWKEMIGYKPNELKSNFETWENLVQPEDLFITMQAINDYLKGSANKFEVKFKMKHKDGHLVTIFSQGKVIKYDAEGNPKLFSGTHLDISEITKIQGEKEEIYKLLNSIQSVAKIGGWQLNTDTFETTWTNETYHIHELPVGTPTNKVNGISFYAEHERGRISALIEKCITDGIQFDEEFEFITHKQNHRWVRVVGMPIKSLEGKLTSLQGTFQDITEAKSLRIKLEEEKIKSLQASKLATLGEMAAGVAHEINNPLAIISGNAQILSRVASKPEKIPAISEKIAQNVQRISKIVSGLKKFSRSSDITDKKQASLYEIISDSLNLVEPKAHRHNTEIKFNEFNDFDIYCDGLQIEQIIVNLIGNAIDATGDSENSWVEIFVLKNNQAVEVMISDSGSGIPDEEVEKLFNPFFTTKAIGKGTGLGLSISQGIAKDHGGKLEYKLLDGHTTFILSLPVEVEEENAA